MNFTGDGMYNPWQGDFPLITGDQALYFIFNDDRRPIHPGEPPKMRLEIHGMAYAFDLPNDSAFKNTIFLKYRVINRSPFTYHDTYIGVFNDFDIGYYGDDYTGCDVQRASYYAYNGTPVDGNGKPEAYGVHPPAQAVTILSGSLMDPDNLDNPQFDNLGHQLCNESVNGSFFGDGIEDNERYGLTGATTIFPVGSGAPLYMAFPSYPQDYYKYLGSKWLDSIHMVYGGDGQPYRWLWS